MQDKGASWDKEKAGVLFSTMRVNHLTNEVFNILPIIENSIKANRFWVIGWLLCNLTQLLGVFIPPCFHRVPPSPTKNERRSSCLSKVSIPGEGQFIQLMPPAHLYAQSFNNSSNGQTLWAGMDTEPPHDALWYQLARQKRYCRNVSHSNFKWQSSFRNKAQDATWN